MSADRSVLAELLWPNRDEADARTALRRTIYELRNALGEGAGKLLTISRTSVSLNAAAVDCDVLAFQNSILPTDKMVFRSSNAFMDGFAVGAEQFDSWVEEQRHRISGFQQDRAKQLGFQSLRQGDFEIARQAAELALIIDPYDEESCRLQMRAYAALGRRGEALQCYKRLSKHLLEELDVKPEKETASLAEHLERGEKLLPKENLQRPLAPSIAVLPFRNLTGSDRNDFLVEALGESVTTELSRDRSLFVIASESAGVYKRRLVDAPEIARELGIRYLLDGSVQIDAERVRVEVHLTDGVRNTIVWSERYDRDRSEIMHVQDEISSQVVATLRGYKGVIQRSELKRSRSKPEVSLTAYEHLMRGMALKERFLKEDMRKARICFEKAIRLDSEMAMAHGWLAWTWFFEVYMGWSEEPQEALVRTFDAAKTAISLDPDLDFAHWAMGAAHLASGDCEMALAGFDRALQLNPNNSDALANRAWPLMFIGKSEAAIEDLTRAMRLNPYFPDWYLWGLGMAQFAQGDSEAATLSFRRMLIPNDQSQAFLLVALAEIGADTKAATARLRSIAPSFSIGAFLGGLHFSEASIADRLSSALQANGFDL
jgi:TolB-like protein/Tfp pilus assembly protein PilF